jgi:hypothetical protein
MSSFPRADEIVAAYEDQVEALTLLLRARGVLGADPRSRFRGLSEAAIQNRLREDREELDRWALMALVASFEATLRTDAVARKQSRTKDAMIRKPLRDLYLEHEHRVRLDDLLSIWEAHAVVGATEKQTLRNLLRHRNWLAHGRHWTNKHGAVPSPLDARAQLDEYVQALQATAPDFPLG